MLGEAVLAVLCRIQDALKRAFALSLLLVVQVGIAERLGFEIGNANQFA